MSSLNDYYSLCGAIVSDFDYPSFVDPVFSNEVQSRDSATRYLQCIDADDKISGFVETSRDIKENYYFVSIRPSLPVITRVGSDAVYVLCLTDTKFEIECGFSKICKAILKPEIRHLIETKNLLALVASQQLGDVDSETYFGYRSFSNLNKWRKGYANRWFEKRHFSDAAREGIIQLARDDENTTVEVDTIEISKHHRILVMDNIEPSRIPRGVFKQNGHLFEIRSESAGTIRSNFGDYAGFVIAQSFNCLGGDYFFASKEKLSQKNFEVISFSRHPLNDRQKKTLTSCGVDHFITEYEDDLMLTIVNLLMSKWESLPK